MEKIIKNKKYAFLLAIFAMLLWGSAFPVLKISYAELNIAADDNMSKMFFAGIRFLLAGIIVFTFANIFHRDEFKSSKKNFKFLIYLGLVQTTLQYLFFYIGIGNTSGIKSSILQSASTFLVVIMSHFVFADDKFTNKKFVALLFGFAGIIVANLGKGFDLSFKFNGEFFMLISSILGAYGTILIKKHGKGYSPYVITAYQMILGSLILIVVGRLGMDQGLQFNLKSGLLFVYTAFLSAVAFFLWSSLLQHYKAGEITVLRLFIPIFGAILSSIFLNESFSLNLILGLILVIVGIYVLNKPEKAINK